MKKFLLRCIHFIQRLIAPETVWEFQVADYFRQFGFAASFQTKESIDLDGHPIPWYTYPAIEFLREFDFSSMRVFEFGTGNSTFWWAERANSVEAVEHNREWYEKWKSRYPGNVKVHFHSNKNNYTTALTGQYDIIVIDGDWRDLCAETALNHISNDGIIILDDAQRVQHFDEYKTALKLLRNDPRFLQIDFYGFTPIATHTKITTLFIARTGIFHYQSEYVPEYGIGNLRNEQ